MAKKNLSFIGSAVILLLVIHQASAYLGSFARCSKHYPLVDSAKLSVIQRHDQLSSIANNNDGNQKWENGIEDETGEKIESVKAAIFSAIGGTIAVLPFALIRGALLHFNADWEFNYDGLLILTAPLFGITYRYAIRRDNNPNLKQGVIGAFVITRAVATVKVADMCSSIPLNCGPPFYLFTTDMLTNGLVNFVEAGICLGGSAYLMETLFKSNALSKFPKMK